VIVQVVTERLDVIDAPVAIGARDVRLEENKRDKAVVLISRDALHALQLERRLLLREGDRGDVRDGLADLLKFLVEKNEKMQSQLQIIRSTYLKEDLGDDLVRRVLEVDREDNNDTVALRLDEDRLFIAVLDVDRVDGLASFDGLEHALERTSKKVALQKAHLCRKRGWKRSEQAAIERSNKSTVPRVAGGAFRSI
jgi:hypothetical protein